MRKPRRGGGGGETLLPLKSKAGGGGGRLVLNPHARTVPQYEEEEGDVSEFSPLFCGKGADGKGFEKKGGSERGPR